jgi:hypothetical protein
MSKIWALLWPAVETTRVSASKLNSSKHVLGTESEHINYLGCIIDLRGEAEREPSHLDEQDSGGEQVCRGGPNLPAGAPPATCQCFGARPTDHPFTKEPTTKTCHGRPRQSLQFSITHQSLRRPKDTCDLRPRVPESRSRPSLSPTHACHVLKLKPYMFLTNNICESPPRIPTVVRLDMISSEPDFQLGAGSQ